MKGRSAAGAATRFEWTAAAFETTTQDEIVSQTNLGGRSTFQNAGATRRRGLELAASVTPAADWLVQLSYTLIDARYSDGFASCAVSPCVVPNLLVPAGNRIPGIARSALAFEAGWRPAKGWRGGVEARWLGDVPVNDLNADAAAAFLTVAAHVGYLVEAGGWKLATTARIDNLFNKKYAGSVIVNEGNGRYFEPAAGRSLLLSVSGSYAF